MLNSECFSQTFDFFDFSYRCRQSVPRPVGEAYSCCNSCTRAVLRTISNVDEYYWRASFSNRVSNREWPHVTNTWSHCHETPADPRHRPCYPDRQCRLRLPRVESIALRGAQQLIASDGSDRTLERLRKTQAPRVQEERRVAESGSEQTIDRLHRDMTSREARLAENGKRTDRRPSAQGHGARRSAPGRQR